MKLTKDMNILIVGLGVIGGGYAKGLTDKGYEVYCITKNMADIDYAIAHKMIKDGCDFVDANLVGRADIPRRMTENNRQILRHTALKDKICDYI